MFQECFGDDSGISLERFEGISGLFSEGFFNLSEVFFVRNVSGILPGVFLQCFLESFAQDPTDPERRWPVSLK